MTEKKKQKGERIVDTLGWYACPAEVELDGAMTIYERAVLHNLMAHANRKGNFPSRDGQAKEIGCSKNSVSEARKSLIAKGWLKRSRIFDEGNRKGRQSWEILKPGRAETAEPFVAPAAEEPKVEKSGSKDVAEVIDAFKRTGLNPHVSFGNITQRKAAEELIKEHGKEKVIKYVEFARAVTGKRFAPSITTPVQLRDKLGTLAIYAERLKEEKPKVAIID